MHHEYPMLILGDGFSQNNNACAIVLVGHKHERKSLINCALYLYVVRRK